MKKDYFNQEAYNYIASQINKTKINSVFKPIVIDIILRRRYEYQLDDKYFHRDVESFINNVENIDFENLSDGTTGSFSFRRKHIRLNSNVLKKDMNEKDMENLLETIAHECGHAMNTDEKGNDRTFYYSMDDMQDFIVDISGMEECFVEKESDRIVGNRKLEDAFKYYNKTSGYSWITMYVNAIAVAFGIKERELLSAAIKGEQELYETLNANIKNEKISKEVFADINKNIRFAHIAATDLYTTKGDEDKKGKAMDNWNEADAKIYAALEQILVYRIKNLEWDNLEELQEKLEDIKLSQNAIFNIMEKSIKKEENKEAVKKLAIPDKTKVYAKVMCMEEIIKSKDENSKELISFVQHSESVDEILEFMKQNGIEINAENIALMPEFELSQQKKDEWVKEFCLDGEEWDNTELINYMIAHKKEFKKLAIFKMAVVIAKKIKKIPATMALNYMYNLKEAPRRFWNIIKNGWKAFSKKEKPLLLGERRKRKNGRQEIVGAI